MSVADEKLAGIANLLKKGVVPPRESVRSFLLWFGASDAAIMLLRTYVIILQNTGLSRSPISNGPI